MSHQLKFTLVLLPYNDVIKSEISQCTKSKAIIELKLKSTKSWNDVFQYLEKKWFGVTDLQSRLEIFAFDLGNSFVIDYLSYRIHDKIISVDNSKNQLSFGENNSSPMLTVYYNLKANGSFNNDLPSYCTSENYDLFHTGNEQSENFDVFQADNARTPFSMPINQSYANYQSQEYQSYCNVNEIDSYSDELLPHNYLVEDINNSINTNVMISSDIQDQQFDNFNYPSNTYENTYHQQSLLSQPQPPIKNPVLPLNQLLRSYQLPNILPNAVNEPTLESAEIPSITYVNNHTNLSTSVTSNVENEFTFSGLDFEIDFSNYESSAVTLHNAPLISIHKNEILSNNIIINSSKSTTTTNNYFPSTIQTTNAALPEQQQPPPPQRQQFHNTTENTSQSISDIIDLDFDLDLQFSQFGNSTTFRMGASTEECHTNRVNHDNNSRSSKGEVVDVCKSVDLSFENINQSQDLSKSAVTDMHSESNSSLPAVVDDSTVEGAGKASVMITSSTTTTTTTAIVAVSSQTNNFTGTGSETETNNIYQDAEAQAVYEPKLVVQIESEAASLPQSAHVVDHHHPTEEINETQIDIVEGEKMITNFLDKEYLLPPLIAIPTISSQPLHQLQLFKNLFIPKSRKFSEYSNNESKESHLDSYDAMIGREGEGGGGATTTAAVGVGAGAGKKRIKRCWEDGITSEDSAGDGESREGMDHLHHTTIHHQQQQLIENEILSHNIQTTIHCKDYQQPVAGCVTSTKITESSGSSTIIDNNNNLQQESPVVLSFPLTINKLHLSLKNRRKPWLRRITPTYLGPSTKIINGSLPL